jgi:hypothetical protein
MGSYALSEKIKNCERPKGTKVIIKNDTPYVYIQYHEKGTNKTKTGKEIGQINITNDEYVFEPNSYYLSLDTITDKEYGGYALLNYHCISIFENLKKVFNSDTAKILYVFSLLAVVYPNIRVYSADKYYEHSFISNEYVGLKLGGQTLSKKLYEIGAMKTNMENYMKLNIEEGGEYFTDGTLVQNSGNNGIAAWSREDKNPSTPLINVIYIYDANKHTPVYYKMFSGSIVDAKGIISVVKESGIKNASLIADKGFFNEELVKLYDESNLSYLMPIKKNSKIIQDKFDYQFEGNFVLGKDRYISYKKIKIDDSHFLYCFKDNKRALNKTVDYTNKIKNQEDSYTIENFNICKEKFGVICLY